METMTSPKRITERGLSDLFSVVGALTQGFFDLKVKAFHGNDDEPQADHRKRSQ
jgi:hypothetical protein